MFQNQLTQVWLDPIHQRSFFAQLHPVVRPIISNKILAISSIRNHFQHFEIFLGLNGDCTRRKNFGNGDHHFFLLKFLLIRMFINFERMSINLLTFWTTVPLRDSSWGIESSSWFVIAFSDLLSTNPFVSPFFGNCFNWNKTFFTFVSSHLSLKYL